MGEPRKPLPVKFILGVIARPDCLHLVNAAVEALGGADLISEKMPFDKTDYYKEEMGDGLIRFWLSLNGLGDPEELPHLKLRTNELEREYSEGDRRKMNLDPGYITESNLVLASTKAYNHRIYLKEGIYAEVTLIYRKKTGYEPLPWTYPDYRTRLALDFFGEVRRLYREELKKEMRKYAEKHG